VVDGEGYTANRAYTIATPTFAQEYPDAIKVILEELEKASVWADKKPKDVAELLAPQLNIDKDVLEAASRRRPYGVIPVDQKITDEQQNVADTFHKLGLIKKQIQVSELVAQNPQWLPEGIAKI
jgi:sulfonate transport system substrate-binding protein